MSDKKEIKVTAAKGRPMLTWVGKHPLRHVTAFPAQHMETYDPTGEFGKKKADSIWQGWPEDYPKSGLLFHGDNKEVLAHLLANGFRGKVNLVYIDPPFDSGADYVRKVQLRGVAGTAKIDGEAYTLGEQIQYTDIWANDNYLQFMYERLLLLKELLTDNGNIWIHADWHKNHHLRCLMDEVFGEGSLKNEIIWRYSKYQMRGMSRFVNNHDILYWYSKGDSHIYNVITEDLQEPKLLKRKKWDKNSKKIVNIRDENGKLVYDEYNEGKVDDVWSIDIIGATSGERLDYPTQKPFELVERIISASSNPGDLILDCFIGSGTTAAVAQKLGRRWIGCDINKGAIQTTARRVQYIISEQVKEAHRPEQLKIVAADGEEKTEPAQLTFTTWRVNNYDLAIQHNEAVNLACEHVGIQRTRSDSFFDGTLGKKLVKIIPFGHPLTPLDLEEIKKELEARPEEDRSIVVVCLGKEMAADSWLEEWNRLRKGGDAVNRFEIIELRTDPKYGKFIVHQPIVAKVSINRVKDIFKIVIEDLISPTILERLDMDMPLFRTMITDWRSMVDCVMIDTAYNEEIFNVALSDVPEKKSELVKGSYELPAPRGETFVAVKIIDMLGEEIIITKRL